MAGFIGALIGYWLGGWLGAILGFFALRLLFGGFSGVAGTSWSGAFNRSEHAEQFFNTAFILLGYLAKADGRVSEEEIAQAEALMRRMGISGQRREQAIADFKIGSAADFDLTHSLDRFNQLSRFQPQLKQTLIAFLVEMAMADGELDSSERQVLQQIATGLGFDAASISRLLEMLKAQHDFAGQQSATQRADELASAYRALGVESSASDREVKRAYRKLMSQYHPDKMIAKGVPEDMLAMATEKAQEIQAAYDVIEKARKAAQAA